MAEAAVCLRDQDIDNEEDGIDRVRQAHGLSKNDGGVGREQGIDYASKRSATRTEAVGA